MGMPTPETDWPTNRPAVLASPVTIGDPVVILPVSVTPASGAVSAGWLPLMKTASSIGTSLPPPIVNVTVRWPGVQYAVTPVGIAEPSVKVVLAEKPELIPVAEAFRVAPTYARLGSTNQLV